MNGIFILVFAFTVVGSFLLIPHAIQQDRLLEEPEDIDYDALDAERDTRDADDADAARKEYGF